MNSMLWVTQALVASIFLFSAVQKGTQPKAKLVATGQTGITHYPVRFVRFIAGCELLGTLGLVLPWWLGIARVLTPLAAIGLSIIMLGAAASHARLAREEPARRVRERLNVATNLVILCGCAFIAAGRFSML